jgi:hypothetical protein
MDLVIFAVERRLVQLEAETRLIFSQINAMSMLTVVPQIDIDTLLQQSQILRSLHSILQTYHQSLCRYYLRVCSLKEFLNRHFAAIRSIPVSPFFKELTGHQNAFEAVSGLALSREGHTIDSLVQSLYFLFPYESMFEKIICNQSRFASLLKIALSYSRDRHRQSLKAVYDLFRPLNPDPILILAIAEVSLSFFVSSQFTSNVREPIENFSFAQHCQSLIDGDLLRVPTALDLAVLKNCEPPDLKSPPFYETHMLFRHEMGFEDASEPTLLIKHVVYQLRKLCLQNSVLLMTFILWQASEWLVRLLSNDARLAGADESFQFFVLAVCEAKLFEFPAILDALEQLTLDDLKTSRVTFLITQLRIAHTFIESRMIGVPAVFLFPFVDHRLPNLSLISTDAIELRGFAVFAFPLFANCAIPAGVCCTGKHSDRARMYPFRATADFPAPNAWSMTGTRFGAVYHFDEAQFGTLIGIPDGDFVSVLDEVALVSNLLQMIPKQVRRAQTSMIPELLQMFSRCWGIPEEIARVEVLAKVRNMQRAMKDGGFLRPDYEPAGILDVETMQAVKRIVPFNSGHFFIDAKIWAGVCRRARG